MNLIQNTIKLCLMKRGFCLKTQSLLRGFCDTSDDMSLVDEEVIKNERIFSEINAKQFECLAKSDEDLNQIEVILSQYQHLMYSTSEVPTTITTDQMRQLMELKTWHMKNRFLNNLYNYEIRSLVRQRQQTIDKYLKRNQLMKKWNKSSAERTGIFDHNGDIVYGLWHNSLFTRISPQYLRRYSLNRCRVGEQFGQHIVIDCGTDPQMNPIRCSSKLSQLAKSFSVNRNQFEEPFCLSFCNTDHKSTVWQQIQQNMKLYANKPHFLSTFTQKSYLDLFDKKSLVYLSPKADKPLEYDFDKVYIIGLSDDFQTRDLLRVKAREEKIPFRRLPLDEHVFWSGHTKDLKIWVVLNILNDVKNGIHWKDAIERHVPKMFLKSREQIESEESYRMAKVHRKREIQIDLKEIWKTI